MDNVDKKYTQTKINETTSIFGLDPESDFKMIVIWVGEDGYGGVAIKSHTPEEVIDILEQTLEYAKAQILNRN